MKKTSGSGVHNAAVGHGRICTDDVTCARSGKNRNSRQRPCGSANAPYALTPSSSPRISTHVPIQPALLPRNSLSAFYGLGISAVVGFMRACLSVTYVGVHAFPRRRERCTRPRHTASGRAHVEKKKEKERYVGIYISPHIFHAIRASMGWRNFLSIFLTHFS